VAYTYRYNAETLAGSPALRDAIQLIDFHARDESTPTRLPTVAEGFIATHRAAHGGAQSIGTHEQFSFNFFAIGHTNANTTWSRLVTYNCTPCLNSRAQCLDERLL